MGMTLTEKIISLHAGEKHVEPGRHVSVSVDRCLLGERCFHDVIRRAKEAGDSRPDDSSLLVVALDQMAGACEEERLERIHAIRDFARSWEIERLYEWGEGGIGAITFPDGGHIRPGDLVVGGDRMNLTFGALGAMAISLEGSDLHEVIMRGKVDYEVPPSLRLVFRGKPDPWVGGKDFAIHAIGLLGFDFLRGKAVEIGGEAIAALDMPERLAMASFAANLGPANVIFETDEKTEAFVRARCDRNFLMQQRDDDAGYTEIIEIDVTAMGPQVLIPSKPDLVVRVAKCQNVEIDHVILGTGGNGRIEDIRLAAGLLREHLIHDEVGITLIPGTQQAFLHAIEEGLIQILIHSGMHIGLPSNEYSDLCHLRGMAGHGMRCLSTSGYIYPEEEISGDNEIIYCNPAVAAASAVLGYIVDPFDMMRRVKRTPTGLMG